MMWQLFSSFSDNGIFCIALHKDKDYNEQCADVKKAQIFGEVIGYVLSQLRQPTQR
jgi:hypothetical protein